jgi:hypothetical protein
MFVAWMTTVSIGVLVARFFRSVWSKAFFLREAAWFQVGGRKAGSNLHLIQSSQREVLELLIFTLCICCVCVCMCACVPCVCT